MLQRAASNAYSWWWASHIRTKQSKWMEQNLLDMEEKVQTVLKLLQEDGDSFARRAEMYYKRRPELISFVEESFRAYRSLADRYDHISTELQNANNTIASVCPDQVPYMDEDDDDDGSPRAPRRKIPGAVVAAAVAAEEPKPENIPKVPKPPIKKDLKSVIWSATKKLNPKKANSTSAHKANKAKSGLNRKEAIAEIDKLQKQILELQTVKEFVKSSYDNAIARYWETEDQIKELQERVSNLQDELGEGVVIDDEEARRLMAEAALKSCQDTLTQLQHKQAISVDETKIGSKRVKEVKAKLSSLMNKFEYDKSNPKEPRAKRDIKEEAGTKELDEEMEKMTQQRQELQVIEEKIKEHFEADSDASLSVTEMAEKIDELVSKVVSLETAVDSQTAVVARLRAETDELNGLVRILECDKEGLISDKAKLSDQLREMEEKLNGVQDLSEIIEDQNSNLQTHFTEARCNLDHISEKVQNVKPDEEEVEVGDISKTERSSSSEAKSKNDPDTQEAPNKDNVLLKDEMSNSKPMVEVDEKSDNKPMVEVDEKSDNKPMVEIDEKSDKKPNVVAGMVEDEVKLANKATVEVDEKSDNKPTAVAGMVVEVEVNSDNKPMVTDSLEKYVKSDNELDVTGSLENEVRKVTDSLKMEETTAVQPQEKTSHSRNNAMIGSTEDVWITSAINLEERQHEASNGADSSFKQQEKDSEQKLSETEATTLPLDSHVQAMVQGDEPDWKQLFTKGMQDREKSLLSEYTNMLRNYKDMKKKLSEVEQKTHDSSLELTELKTSNAMKDEEIRLLRHKLGLLQRSMEDNEVRRELTSVNSIDKRDLDNIFKIEAPESTSAIEEKFRLQIDELLEENLDFWLKFSSSFTEIQKFETTTKDLQLEVSKLEVKWKSSEGSSSSKYSLKSDARPLFKHLSEIQNELTHWLENSVMLKEELQCRFSSLCEIQEELTTALKDSAEDDDFRFTSYQAAKFQGEVLNMKQENNRVADELQAGLDLITTLQIDVEQSLKKLNDQFGLSSSRRTPLRNSEYGNRVPLRSFIFGVKPKKQKQSIFSCMTPGMQRKYRALRG